MVEMAKRETLCLDPLSQIRLFFFIGGEEQVMEDLALYGLGILSSWSQFEKEP